MLNSFCRETPGAAARKSLNKFGQQNHRLISLISFEYIPYMLCAVKGLGMFGVASQSPLACYAKCERHCKKL